IYIYIYIYIYTHTHTHTHTHTQCIYGSRYFKVVTAPKDWNSAELDCQNQGGNLASIHSAEEHAFLVSLVKTVGNINVWIGRSDAVKEGSWIWSDGRKSQISKWGPGEPNNAGNGEHCHVKKYKKKKKKKLNKLTCIVVLVCCSSDLM
uniref:C-type lectin domain-containing protein n=1 Tax=Denticeps clupeoides TaxID=299321 RepID=A0AAY4DIH0_9TELE